MRDNTQNGGASYILSCTPPRSTRKLTETRQIPLGSPCEVNHYPKASLGKRLTKATLSTESDLQREIAESKAAEGIGGFEHSSEAGRGGLNLTESLPVDEASLALPLTSEGGES